MNILIITPGYLPIPAVKGGAVESLIDLIIEDNEYTNNHNIQLYSIYDKDAFKLSKYKNCQINYINSQNIGYKLSRIFRGIINKIPGVYIGNAYIARVKRMMNKLDLNNIDFIIVENCPEFALVLKTKLKSKLILHLHNDSLNKDTKLNKKIFDSYFKVLAISNFVANRLKEIDKKNDDKVNVLYNGINLSKFDRKKYDPVKIRKRYNISNSSKIVMFSGRLVREKGVKELIEAFIKIPMQYDIKLLIVGGLSYSNNKEDCYIRELKELSKGYEDRIIFTGFVNYDDIPQLYSIADIGIIPSLCNDAFNLTTVEFMQNGVPVIVSGNGAMKELITCDSGIVIDENGDFIELLKSAIIRLLLDDNLRKSMGENAKKYVAKFSKEIYCDKFNNYLKRFGLEIYNYEV